MNIKLRFVNRSNDCGNSEVVLFQRDVIPDLDAFAIAWKVIRYCGRDCFHPFDYSTDIDVALGVDRVEGDPLLRTRLLPSVRLLDRHRRRARRRSRGR